MKKILFILLLLNCAAFSNECVIRFGRNDEIVNVQATNISMREEEITITLRKDYYEVDVTFDFFNSGVTEKVLLGFPVRGTFYDIRDNEMYDFKSYINGKIIPVRTIKKDTIPGMETNIDKYIKWFIRDVTFTANSRTVSRVTYKAEYSECGGITLAGYIYGTGRFWEGGIGKMTVIVNHGDDVLIDRITFGENYFRDDKNINAKSSKFIWETDGRYKYIFEHVTPTHANDNISIAVGRFETGLYGKYDDLFGILDCNVRGDYISNYHYDYWWAWSEHLLYKNPTDIQFYTKNQIRLFINFFSAIHGYDFKNPLYKEYFSKLENFGDKNNTKYKVNPNFDENVFNEIERKNVNYLLKLEKMIPK